MAGRNLVPMTDNESDLGSPTKRWKDIYVANVTGNAETVTKLATARTISLTGDVTGSASFDGSDDASITATVADDSHNHTIANVDSLQTTLDGKAASSHTHAGTDVTSAVANATTAATATKLATARTISLTGDVTGSASFDGSDDASITATVADDSHNHVISNVDSLQTTLDGKVPTGRTVTAGNGMTGGGALSGNITLTMGTPSSISSSSTNSVTSTSHTHAITGFSLDDHIHSDYIPFRANDIADLNSAIEDGIYSFYGSTNTPDGFSGYGEVYVSTRASGAVSQIFITRVAGETGKAYFRYCFSNVWYAWKCISVDGHTHVGGDVTSAVANATTAASCSGNAATATKLATARTISLTGDVTGSASFDGSANASITATVANDSHTHSGLTTSAWSRVQTDSGYIDFGPANTTWAHIYTDRPSFYFNKPLSVNGTVVSLDGHTHDYLATTGKAADSDKLDGYNSATDGTASTVPVRNSSGDITTRLFRSTYANQATISGALAFRTNNTTDNYIRFCSDMAAVRTFIGCAATSHTHSYVPTGRTVTAGNGMTGGGALSDNITLTMGTPSTCSASSINNVTSTSHTHTVVGFVPIPTSSTLPVGTVCMCINLSTTNVANGSTIAGSNLQPISVMISYGQASYAGGGILTGTWKNIMGATVEKLSGSGSTLIAYPGLFVRTA